MNKVMGRLKAEKGVEATQAAEIEAPVRQSRRFDSAAKLLMRTRARRWHGDVLQLNRPTICPRCGEVSQFESQARVHAQKCEEQAILATREEERVKRRGEWTLQLYVEVLEGVGMRAASHAAREAAARAQGEDPIQNAQVRVELESTGLVLEVPAWPARQTGFAVGEIVQVQHETGGLNRCSTIPVQPYEVLGNSKGTTSLTLSRVVLPKPDSPKTLSSGVTIGPTRIGKELEVRSSAAV